MPPPSTAWAPVRSPSRLGHGCAPPAAADCSSPEPWPARPLCPWGSPGKNTAVGCQVRSPLGELPQPRIEPVALRSPALAGGFFTPNATWEAPWSSNSFLISLISNLVLGANRVIPYTIFLPHEHTWQLMPLCSHGTPDLASGPTPHPCSHPGPWLSSSPPGLTAPPAASGALVTDVTFYSSLLLSTGLLTFSQPQSENIK